MMVMAELHGIKCRKPLMIMAIFGYLVLDVVFLINAFWFHQLRVGGRDTAIIQMFRTWL